MADMEKHMGNVLIEKSKAKAFLAEQAIRRPSLHWWVTHDHSFSQLIFEELKNDFYPLIVSTNETTLRIELQNKTVISCLALYQIEQHRGESPDTIVFDKVEIPHNTWISFFTMIKGFGTLNTFFIGSNVK